MAVLLDVNVLIALAWPNHVFHEPAHRWLRKHKSYGWATCPLTQAGFVRVSSNPRALPGARSPQEALDILREIVRVGHHHFWPDDVALVSDPWISKCQIVGHRQITDAHLLALAIGRGEQIATFDAAMQHLLPAVAPAGTVVVVSA